MTILYVFSDKGIPGACKIGKSATQVSRYRQARAHNPRGIQVEAMFDLGSGQDAAAAERFVGKEFAKYQRPGRTKEWFDIDSKSAIALIRQLPCMAQAHELRELPPRLPNRDIYYDDWREVRPQFAEYKWRMFLFGEDGPERRLKLSYGALYDTAYRYAFTYNPWPVHLIAGFESPAAPERKSAVNIALNAQLEQIWTKLQKSMGKLFAEEVGWLNSRVAPRDVASFLRSAGVEAFDLRRGKPMGAPPKDASVSPTPYGSVEPLHQVQPSPEIYGANP